VSEPESQQAERDFIHRQRVGLGVVVVLTAFMILFSVLLVKLAKVTAWNGFPVVILTLWGVVVCLYLYVIATMLHRKWTTGRFMMSRVEAAAKQTEIWSRIGAGKPLWPQRWYLFFSVFFLAIPVVLAIEFVYLFRIPGQPWPYPLIPILILVVVLIAVSVWFIFKAIRRELKTGSLLLSQEEIAKLRVRTRKPQSLRFRILLANFWAFLAGSIAFSPISTHIRHHASSSILWVLSPAYGIIAACYIWQVFHPTNQLSAVTDVPEEPQKNPMSRGKLIALAVVLPLVLASIVPIVTVLKVHPLPDIFPAPTQAKADLAAALQFATQSHKRVLVEFGANSDPDSRKLDQYLHEKTNQSILESGFISVFVNTDSSRSDSCTCDANWDMAYRYAISLDKGIPALAVLNEKGELIHSQQNGEFAEMRHRPSSDLTDFLLRWKP